MGWARRPRGGPRGRPKTTAEYAIQMMEFARRDMELPTCWVAVFTVTCTTRARYRPRKISDYKGVLDRVFNTGIGSSYLRRTLGRG